MNDQITQGKNALGIKGAKTLVEFMYGLALKTSFSKHEKVLLEPQIHIEDLIT